jgi:uncharacterized protein
MRRLWRGAVVACLLFACTAGVAAGQAFPTARGYVTDEAGVLSPDTVSRLETRLAALEKDTTAEVAVVVALTLDGYSIEQYAVGLFEKWGIGKRGQDNGVLFLVAYVESEVRIEVGYGLEAIITDGRAGRILDREVIPYLRDDNFDDGLTAGVSAIEEFIRSGVPPSPLEDNPVQNIFDGFRLPESLVIGMGVATVYMVGFMARTRSVWLGGIWGLILGVVLGFGFGTVVAAILLPIGLGVVGTLLDLLLSANYRGRLSSGLPTSWTSSRGGFSGGGRSSGFGGFGGGRSGGGGASRRF